MTKPIEVVFEPGCFDQFEGAQEELDQMIKEIQGIFENKTPEEIQAMSRPLDIDELIEEDPELAEAIVRQLESIDNPDRKLQ